MEKQCLSLDKIGVQMNRFLTPKDGSANTIGGNAIYNKHNSTHFIYTLLFKYIVLNSIFHIRRARFQNAISANPNIVVVITNAIFGDHVLEKSSS